MRCKNKECMLCHLHKCNRRRYKVRLVTVDGIYRVSQKITFLKFIYNWTKIKEGFEKIVSKTWQLVCTSAHTLPGRRERCVMFCWYLPQNLLIFGPIINEFQNGNFFGTPCNSVAQGSLTSRVQCMQAFWFCLAQTSHSTLGWKNAPHIVSDSLLFIVLHSARSCQMSTHSLLEGFAISIRTHP